MIEIFCRSLTFTILSKTISRIITILLTIRHVFTHLLPTFNCKSVILRALIVPLRSAETGQRQCMVIAQLLGYIYKPIIAFEFRTLDIAITPTFSAKKCKCPSTFGQPGRNIEHDVVHSIISYTIRNTSSLLLISGTCHDIDSTTYRRRRHLRRSKTALCLHRTGHVGKTCPITPINTAPLHIINWNTVYHHTDISSLESTHIDF